MTHTGLDMLKKAKCLIGRPKMYMYVSPIGRDGPMRDLVFFNVSTPVYESYLGLENQNVKRLKVN